MQIHEFKSIIKRTQRIGRSGKRGSYSGRGVKGQKSRSGHRIRPAERDLIIRLPKLRGFRNKPKFEVGEVFNLGKLSTQLAAFVQGKAPLELNAALLRKGPPQERFQGPYQDPGYGRDRLPGRGHGAQGFGKC